MRRELIVSELKNRGYNAELQTIIKNSVKLDGIRISTNSNISPIIYIDEIIRRAIEENKSINDVVDVIVGIYEKEVSDKIKFDIKNLFDKEFVLSHLYIALQKESDHEQC